MGEALLDLFLGPSVVAASGAGVVWGSSLMVEELLDLPLAPSAITTSRPGATLGSSLLSEALPGRLLLRLQDLLCFYE